jgi:hypothetical protein
VPLVGQGLVAGGRSVDDELVRSIDTPAFSVRPSLPRWGGDVIVTGVGDYPEGDPEELPAPPGTVHQIDATTGVLRRTFERRNRAGGCSLPPATTGSDR